MDTPYLKFQLDTLEVQLSLAGAKLSDFDKSQNRVRSADGTWAKSPSGLSDVEKIDALLEKDRGVWRADSATRQKQISDIAQTLAKADKETQKKILTDLAPALSQLGDDLDSVDIEERKRIVSDLDTELKKRLPQNQANKLVTDLILDIDEFDFDAKWTGVREEATADLEKTLSEIASIKNPTLTEGIKKSFQKIIDQIAPKKPVPEKPVPEKPVPEKPLTPDQQFYRDAQDKIRKKQEKADAEVASKAEALRKKQEKADAEAASKAEALRKAEERKARFEKRDAIALKNREKLKAVGANTKKLFNDIATMTIAGFEASLKKLDETEIDKRFKEKFAQELEETTQDFEKIGNAVQDAVTAFFKNNIEAYYESRSEVGKEKYKKVKAILDKAKLKVDNIQK